MQPAVRKENRERRPADPGARPALAAATGNDISPCNCARGLGSSERLTTAPPRKGGVRPDPGLN